MLFQKILAFFIGIFYAATGSLGIVTGDSMYGHEFPIIEAAELADGDIRIMSFNTRYSDVNGVGLFFRKDIIREQIAELQPDSVGLQEATRATMKYLRRNLTGYKCVGVDRDHGKENGKGEYTAIFYREDKYTAVDSGNFWLSETPDEPSYGPEAGCRRVCTWVILENKETGIRFVHINTHFDNVSGNARTFAANMLSEYIKANFDGMNVVFTADMNTNYGAPYNKMTSVLADTRYSAKDSQLYCTFHDGNPETRADCVLDYVLCSPEIKVSSFRAVTAGVAGRMSSDHFPIYADIRLPEQSER